MKTSLKKALSDLLTAVDSVAYHEPDEDGMDPYGQTINEDITALAKAYRNYQKLARKAKGSK